MIAGDVIVDTLQIGSLDLTDPRICQYEGFDVFEDLFQPYGPSAIIKVNDFNDALGKYNINGKENVKIAFSTEKNGSAFFDLKCETNRNLIDGSERGSGALKSKIYDINCVSPEQLNAQVVGNIDKSYPTQPAHVMMQDLVKNVGFISKKPFICDDPTRPTRSYKAVGHPIKVYSEINDLAVSTINRSSLYVLFVTDQKYRYCTIEQLCMQPPKETFIQTDLSATGFTEEQRQKTITDIVVPLSFYATPRAKLSARYKAYDTTTGKSVYSEEGPDKRFKHLDNPYAKELDKGPFSQTVYVLHDRNNTEVSTGLAKARLNREAYYAHFVQNYAELTINGTPNIKLGDVINIRLPNKSTFNNGEELQFNGPVLVTAIHHLIGPLSKRPRYNMRLKVCKAGGFYEVGE